MDDDYEKELAGYVADMLPLQREMFEKAVTAATGAYSFTQAVKRRIALDLAANYANISKKTIEINAQNLTRDELIALLSHALVSAETDHERKDLENRIMHSRIFPKATGGAAKSPRQLTGGPIVNRFFEKRMEVFDQAINSGLKDHVAEKMAPITDGYKQRDDYQDKQYFMAIVRDIHTHHATIQSIINAPALAAYKKKYRGRETLRGWVKEAIPARNFGGKRKK